MTNKEYRIAGYVEECNRFLDSVSGGTISVHDLEIQRYQLGQHMYQEKIAGLPTGITQFVNGADSTSAFYDYKQMLYSILEYKKIHGEIPQYHMKFSWNGQKLQ